MRGLLLGLVLAIGFSSAAKAQDTLTPELLWGLKRLSGGILSPDGDHVVFGARSYDLAANAGDTDLHMVSLDGKTHRRLTQRKGSEGDVQWVVTDSGPRLFMSAKRDGKFTQAWSLDPQSMTWLQVTDIEGGISNLKVAPGGERLAFTKDVKLDETVNDLHKDLPLADARIIDQLMYRHWNQWHDYAYSHLHVAAIKKDGKAGAVRDLMAGMKVDCPVPPFGGSEQFAWSPDGRSIAYTIKDVEDFAQSTDSDVYIQRLDTDTPPRKVSIGRPGYDLEPVWSPNGSHLAWTSMERPGFESDRARILVLDFKTGAIFDATEGLDQMAHGVTWAPDGKSMWFMSEFRGTNQLFSLDLSDRSVTQVTKGQYNWSLKDVSADGKTILMARQSMLRPWELFVAQNGGEPKALTHLNDDAFDKLSLPKVEERWFPASDGKKIHAWVILPPGFDAKKQYPLLTYFQGGPQGQIGQWFSFRWNFHLMAAHGYVVVAPNRRGLPGFGRAWNDEISGDWGGQAMRDILSVHDAMIAEPYVDAKRCGGVGASFGGYTAYWMMGNAEDRFSALIAHCGVFNLESMYGATEELFFVNWDLGGPYWKSPEIKAKYDEFSPHRFVGKWKTPLLVIHGQKDFRVPVTQGMEAFTAAQTNDVPSRFLYFPGEGHWVQSPQNGVLWHRVFFDWLKTYCQDAKPAK